MAVAVADDWQAQGIGRALLLAAVDWATSHGIARLHASALSSNSAVLPPHCVDRPPGSRVDVFGGGGRSNDAHRRDEAKRGLTRSWQFRAILSMYVALMSVSEADRWRQHSLM